MKLGQNDTCQNCSHDLRDHSLAGRCRRCGCSSFRSAFVKMNDI